MVIRLYGAQCVYCGDLATEGDHFPPKCTRKRVYVLPVCHMCNSIAGTNWPYDFVARAEHVKQWRRWKLGIKNAWNAVEYFEHIGGTLDFAAINAGSHTTIKRDKRYLKITEKVNEEPDDG